MKSTLAAVAAAVTLASGCALNGAGNSSATNAVGASMASASAGGVAQARPAGRTREEVHAEALEAAKHHKSTMEEDEEYFLPWHR
jgi:predicted ATPase